VPELKALPTKYIHAPWTAPEATLQQAGVVLGETYPHRIITIDMKVSFLNEHIDTTSAYHWHYGAECACKYTYCTCLDNCDHCGVDSVCICIECGYQLMVCARPGSDTQALAVYLQRLRQQNQAAIVQARRKHAKTCSNDAGYDLITVPKVHTVQCGVAVD
jgi:FAD binding domain of DNA photolyase